MYRKRSKTSKVKKPYRRYRKSALTRRPMTVNVNNDATVKHLNMTHDRPVRIVKSTPIQANFLSSVTSLGQIYTFDPSGTVGSFGSIADWSALIGLYDQYKVTRIKVTWTLQDTASDSANNNRIMYIRYNYNTNVATPSLANISQLTRVVEKNFTQQSPVYQYSFIPKVAQITNSANLLSSDGRELVKMKWCDVSYPVVLYGLVTYLSLALTTTQDLYVDVEYDILFRYNK